MSDANKAVARRMLLEVFGDGKLDVVEEVTHPEFVNHEAGPDNPQGPVGLRETAEWLQGLWGPVRFEIEDEIAEGDRVVIRTLATGHHLGEFLGKEPTGKEYTVEHIHIYRIEDGRVIEHWSVRDDVSQALQLGLFGG